MTAVRQARSDWPLTTGGIATHNPLIVDRALETSAYSIGSELPCG